MGVNAINYLYHLVMGRLLGPVNYGSLASIFSILYIISIVPVSSSFAVVKFISSAKGARERASFYYSVRKLFFYIAVFSTIGMLVASPDIAKFLHVDEVSAVVLVGPILFFMLVTLVNQASLQGILKFIGVVGPNLVASIGKLALGTIFVILGFSVTGAIWGVLLAAIMAYFISTKLLNGITTAAEIKKISLKPFLNYAFPVLLQALAFTAFFTVDVILVKHFLPAFEAGLYAALSTLGKIVFFAAQPITQVMFPIVSGKRAKGERYREVFLASFFLTVFISVGILVFYYLFPDIAIGLLYGKAYLAARGELVWMGAFMVTYTASYIVVNFLLSINRTKIVALPLLAAIGQAVAIWVWHESILQVIQVSLVAMLAMFSGLALYLGYGRFQKMYDKSKG